MGQGMHGVNHPVAPASSNHRMGLESGDVAEECGAGIINYHILKS